jgi:proline iminopeptidase
MNSNAGATEVTETFVVTDDGCRLWTAHHAAADAAPDGADAGPESTAILCHGGPGFWDTLAPIAEILAERRPVVRWDQRGGGRSQHQEPYTLCRFVADVDAVRSAYQVDRPVLVGHSWGASLALQYFLAHPDRVRALIYIAGTGLSWDWRPQHNAAFTEAIAPRAAKFAALRALPRPTAGQQREEDFLRLLTEFRDPGTAYRHVERLLSPYYLSDPAVNQTLNAEMRGLSEADLIERCRTLPASVPVLIVDGAFDPRPRWAVDSLAAALPNVRRLTLPSAGHLPWLDSPDQFAAGIREFLSF